MLPNFFGTLDRMNGVRCRPVINTRDRRYVPVWTPLTCPDPVNTDPKRNEVYCKPKRSFSEPLSSSEYLALVKQRQGQRLSNSTKVVTVGTGEYKHKIWTTVDVSSNIVPAVHPGGYALDSSAYTEARGAYAARGSVSKFDSTNRTEDQTTHRRAGLAIAASSVFNSSGTTCSKCGFSGSTISPGNPECCSN